MNNNNALKLHKAKKVKNDEFYTYYEDIEKELSKYDKSYFENKRIVCPCDGDKSNFTKFLTDKKEEWKIKELKIHNKFQDIDYSKYDLVITNPPFSKIREFLNIIKQTNFIIVIPLTLVGYKDFRDYFMKGKWFMGYTEISNFYLEDGTKYHNYCYWATNLKQNQEYKKKLRFNYSYDLEDYKKYDNYDVIESKTLKIPYNYNGIISVPITFIVYFNKAQFTILKMVKDCILDGKKKFYRYFIKIKKSKILCYNDNMSKENKKNKKITKENEFKNLSFNERMCLVKKEVKFIQKKGIGSFRQKAIQLTDILDRLTPVLIKYNINVFESINIKEVNLVNNSFWGYLTIIKEFKEEQQITRHLYIGKAFGNENINFVQGKASTYSRKYAYLESFGIGTNENDPDFIKESPQPKTNQVDNANKFLEKKVIDENFKDIIKTDDVKKIEDIQEPKKEIAEEFKL